MGTRRVFGMIRIDELVGLKGQNILALWAVSACLFVTKVGGADDLEAALSIIHLLSEVLCL